jgi:hypothetical protein
VSVEAPQTTLNPVAVLAPQTTDDPQTTEEEATLPLPLEIDTLPFQEL